MKKLFTFSFVGSLLLTFVCLCCFLTLANAGPFQTTQGFNNFSSASSAAVYSNVIPVYGYKIKTLQVQGTAMAAKTDAALDGTALVQCGPTKTGPWVTCQNEAGTAISTTTNKVMQWSDSVNYVRISWAKTTGRIKAWLSLLAQ